MRHRFVTYPDYFVISDNQLPLPRFDGTVERYPNSVTSDGTWSLYAAISSLYFTRYLLCCNRKDLKSASKRFKTAFTSKSFRPLESLYDLNIRGCRSTLLEARGCQQSLRKVVEIRRKLHEKSSNFTHLLDLVHSSLSLATMRVHRQLGEVYDVTRDIAARRHIPNDERELANLLTSLSAALHKLGLWNDAYQIAEESVTLLRRHIGADDPALDLAAALDNFAMRLYDTGRYHEAIKESQIAVTMWRTLIQHGTWFTDQPNSAQERTRTSKPGQRDSERFFGGVSSSLRTLLFARRAIGWDGESFSEIVEFLERHRPVVAKLSIPVLASFDLTLYECRVDLRRDSIALDNLENAVSSFRQLANGRPLEFGAQFLALLRALSNHYRDLYSYGRALSAAEQAVDYCRRFASAYPHRFDPELASSLIDLSNRHHDRYSYEEASKNAEEAVVLLRSLAKGYPLVFEAKLASALTILSNHYHDMGLHHEALTAAQVSADLLNPLEQVERQVFAPHLASSFQTLSNRYHDMGSDDGALTAADNAVSILKPFVPTMAYEFVRPQSASSLQIHLDRYPDLHSYDTAFTCFTAHQDASYLLRPLDQDARCGPSWQFEYLLQTLSRRYCDLGVDDGALAAAQAAVTMSQRLKPVHSSTNKNRLASSLRTLLNCHRSFGRYGLAVQIFPDCTPEVASSLVTLSYCHRDLGPSHYADALDIAQDAVKVFTNLGPNILQPQLASSLHTLSNRYLDQGLYDEAFRVAGQAVQKFGDLVQSGGPVFIPYWASSLTTYSAICRDRGYTLNALEYVEQAVKILQTPGEQIAFEAKPQLALSLITLSNCRHDLGQSAPALQVAEDASRLLEHDRNSVVGLLLKISSAKCYRDHGRYDDALTSARDAVEGFWECTRIRPYVFKSWLALSLTTLSECHQAVNEYDDGRSTSQEAVKIYKELSSEVGEDMFRPPLVSSLDVLANCYHREQNYQQAIHVAQEALSIFYDIPSEDQQEIVIRHFASSLSILSICHCQLQEYDKAAEYARQILDLLRKLDVNSQQWRMFVSQSLRLFPRSCRI